MNDHEDNRRIAEASVRASHAALQANDRLERGGEFALDAQVRAQIAMVHALLAVADEIHQHGSV